jgi:hypothetical protein
MLTVYFEGKSTKLTPEPGHAYLLRHDKWFDRGWKQSTLWMSGLVVFAEGRDRIRNETMDKRLTVGTISLRNEFDFRKADTATGFNIWRMGYQNCSALVAGFYAC